MSVTAFNDEKELLHGLRAGSEQSFDRLYERYSLRIYSNILKMVKDENIAQELLQDVFLKVWLNRQQIDPEQSFKSYLFKIAQHLVYNFFRRDTIEQKVKAYIARTSTELHHPVEENLAFNESSAILNAAIQQLPPRRKLIYTLCKLEGKTYEEVSQQLNISTATISDHIVKATKFLRNRYYSNETATAIFLTGLLLR